MQPKRSCAAQLLKRRGTRRRAGPTSSSTSSTALCSLIRPLQTPILYITYRSQHWREDARAEGQAVLEYCTKMIGTMKDKCSSVISKYEQAGDQLAAKQTDLK